MAGFEVFYDDDERLDEPLAETETPCLVLDLDILERNLKRMALRMCQLKVGLRPHFKTHKCPEIAEIQGELQAVGFTASTLEEVRHLQDLGHRDVTLAVPLILNKLPRLCADFLQRPGILRLQVDSPEAVTALEAALADASLPAAHVWLKVDSGYHRAGVAPASDHALELARRLHDSERIRFDGILSHSGHAYDARGRDEVLRVAEEERRVMVDFAERLRAHGIEVPRVSIGSTPAMSVIESLDGITEVRPGNYVFYDYTQVEIGSCEVSNCALTVISSVISSQPGAEHSVIDAGALSLSKDPGPDRIGTSYGRIFSDYERSELEPETRVVSLSQEHGIVNANLAVGTRVRVLPNHSCLVVPNFEHYLAVRGDRIVDHGRIVRDHDD